MARNGTGRPARQAAPAEAWLGGASSASSYESERDRSDVHSQSVLSRTEERGAPFSRPRSAAKALSRCALAHSAFHMHGHAQLPPRTMSRPDHSRGSLPGLR